ncbi:hypothetical protein C2U43_19095 [Citrobacter freundii complex sp. CFNIH9]|nr:hypothetical protein C2U43_19095 [Citrobacter freundii complex sp. CFNIH9]
MWAGPAENCRRVSVRPGGISGGYCVATIFPRGAGIVKGTAIVPLTRSQAVSFQRSEKHKVNVAIYRRQQIHYLRNSCLALLTAAQR